MDIISWTFRTYKYWCSTAQRQGVGSGNPAATFASPRKLSETEGRVVYEQEHLRCTTGCILLLQLPDISCNYRYRQNVQDSNCPCIVCHRPIFYGKLLYKMGQGTCINCVWGQILQILRFRWSLKKESFVWSYDMINLFCVQFCSVYRSILFLISIQMFEL